jgi:protease I
MNQLMRIVLVVSLICFGTASFVLAADSPYLQVIRDKGVTIEKDGNGYLYNRPFCSEVKPNGPLAGKKVALVVGADFSDWQAYYLVSYIGEFGGKVQFVMDNNHLWKSARPMNGIQTEPLGAWGLSLTGGFNGQGMNCGRALSPAVMKKGEGLAKDYPVANPADYDAMIVLGNIGGDVMYPDDVAQGFIKAVADRGVPVGAIAGGILPLIKLKIVNGKNVTGDKSVDYMLKRIANFKGGDVVTDGNLITAKDTYATPALLRSLCKVFDPKFVDKDKGVLKGKRVMAIVTNDFEDIELVAPVMEFMYRGASVTVALFDSEYIPRTASWLSDVRSGQFGVSIPFQEIDKKDYKIVQGKNVKMSDFDALWTPGGLSPWQMIETVNPIQFIKNAYKAGKIVGVICHGPVAAANADIVKGKKVTGWLIAEDPVTIMGGTYNFGWAATWDGGNFVSGRLPPNCAEFVDMLTAALLAK